MKRELNCGRCVGAWPGWEPGDDTRSAPWEKEIDGGHSLVERIRFAPGFPAREGLRCDACNRPLTPGLPAWAVSLWRTDGGIPWFPWEYGEADAPYLEKP